MIFDQPPAELPVATLRPRELETRLWLDLRGWLASKWRWFRPRAIPVAVAFAGLLGLYGAASYFGDLTQRWPDVSDVGPSCAAPQRSLLNVRATRVKVETRPAGAGTFVDGKPLQRLTVENHGGAAKQIAVPPGVYQVKLEPAQPAQPAQPASSVSSASSASSAR
jgi:hypothetical protein